MFKNLMERMKLWYLADAIEIAEIRENMNLDSVDHIDFKWDDFTQTGTMKLKLDVALKKGLFNDALP